MFSGQSRLATRIFSSLFAMIFWVSVTAFAEPHSSANSDSTLPSPPPSAPPSAPHPTVSAPSTNGEAPIVSEVTPKWMRTTAPMDSRFQMWFLPTLSFFLPGFGQYIDMQIEYGLGYSALGLAGMSLINSSDIKSIDISDIDSRDPHLRRVFLGDSLYKIAGGLSSYHSFRVGAASRQSVGEYQFLAHSKAESPLDLMISPFRFDHLMKPTTWVPLAVLAAALTTNGEHWDRVRLGDWGFSTGVSIGAGIGEEAVFRGFIMPYAQEYMKPFWAANTTQAALFGAAHFSAANNAPWPQFLVGLYLGWVTKKNNWQLSESIFIHTWWDVIAISAEYATTGRVDTWRLPTLEFAF